MPRAEFKVMLMPHLGEPAPKWEDMGVKCRADLSSVRVANAYARLLLRTLSDAIEIRWNWQGLGLGHYVSTTEFPKDSKSVLLIVQQSIINPDNDQRLAEPGVYALTDPFLTGLWVELRSRTSLMDQRRAEADWWKGRLKAIPLDWVAQESYHKMAYEFCLHRRILSEYEDQMSLEESA